MSSVGSTKACSTSPSLQVPLRNALAMRLADYLELTKPRIALLVLVVVAVGFTLGGAGNWQLAPLLHAVIGIALVAASSNTLNQYLECSTDARMKRTLNRPLPSGRLPSAEALTFGLLTGILGSLYLAFCVNVLTALLAALTLVMYVAVYTPLKRRTSLCTAIGAIPGALPAVLGWTAAGGRLDWGAFSLFAILFLWQFPHFLAIAWLYRDDYQRAGLRMLPALGPSPKVVGFMSVAYALALIPVSLLPREFALAGDWYVIAALVLGLGYLASAVRFTVNETNRTARELIWSSLIYHPVLLLSLTWDHLQLLR